MKTGCFRHSLPGWILLPLAFGCAGPTSPFGGLELGSGDGEEITNVQIETTPVSKQNVAIRKQELVLTPKRQVLHMASPLQVGVKPASQNAAAAEILVTYNKRNVTGAFQQYAARERTTPSQTKYIYERLRLRPDRRHQIDIYMKDQGKWTAHVPFLPPECPLSQPHAIATVAPFAPPSQFIDTINAQASAQKLSPSLIAGLIAQESGFEPASVSHAKAIGLTQVTPLADEEIRKLRPHWHRDTRIMSLRPGELEGLIRAKKLGAKQDWRLNPALSIEGGSLYLDYLRAYWKMPENAKLLKATPEISTPDVILASYNSGAARVKNKILKHGRDFLDDTELKEAFKYVNNVTSYCYHFSKEAQ